MVSNQKATPSPSRVLLAASATFALLLASGCQLFPDTGKNPLSKPHQRQLT